MYVNGWKDFNKSKPKECGFYKVIIVYTNPLFTESGGILKSAVRWDGENFLLPIGRCITKDVMYWKAL